jgi:hypothetical protein
MIHDLCDELQSAQPLSFNTLCRHVCAAYILVYRCLVDMHFKFCMFYPHTFISTNLELRREVEIPKFVAAVGVIRISNCNPDYASGLESLSGDVIRKKCLVCYRDIGFKGNK